ncbi:MAG TPA: MFS transporter [Balneolales bacterium]|nr:MFS transporter [Balneolales bacterium]HYW96916.1 MFS transporter [Bacteroidales bacterium]
MKKSALTTVFLVVLIDLLGFGIVLPLLPFYAKQFSAGAIAIGLLYSIYSFAQLIFSPIWGGLSDKIGRRPIMLLSTFGNVVAYIMFGLAGSLTVLFLSRLVAGIMGGNISTAQAYVADVTTPEERSKGMGMIGAAFGIGFVIGPAIATGLIHPEFSHLVELAGFGHLAHLIAANKYEFPGFFAALMSFCSFLLVIFKLPETVDTKKAKPVEKDARRIQRNSIFTKKFWRTITEESQFGKKSIFVWLLLSVFMLSFGQSSIYSAFPLFANKVLHMSAEQVGIQFFYIGLIAVFIQGGLIRHLAKKYDEEKIFLTGNILMVIGLGLLSIAVTKTLLMVFLGLMAVGVSLNVPVMNSLISQRADPDQVGKIMGTSQSISGFGRVVGPAWGGALFALAHYLPFVGTALIIAITIIAGIKLVKDKNEMKTKETAEATA